MNRHFVAETNNGRNFSLRWKLSCLKNLKWHSLPQVSNSEKYDPSASAPLLPNVPIAPLLKLRLCSGMCRNRVAHYIEVLIESDSII